MVSLLFKAGGLLLLLAGSLSGLETRTLSTAPDMLAARAGHTATPLTDGRVLFTGGCVVTGCEGGLTESAELFNPERNSFENTSGLALARVGHRAVRLATGKVLILGGWAGDAVTATAESYDPATERFEVIGGMLEPRDGFTATRLHNGQILITGGYSGNMNRLSSAELYVPETERFLALGAMQEARMSHTATLLADGRVLIVGGSNARGQVSDTAELFDPVTQQFSLVGKLTLPRHKHAAVALKNGDVLIVGGAGAGDWDEQYSSTELYDPKAQTFRAAASMTQERFKLPDAIALLPSGAVLVAGGGKQAEVYQPATDTFSPVSGDLGLDLAYTTVVTLQDERLLIAGGYDTGIRVVKNAWFYTTH